MILGFILGFIAGGVICFLFACWLIFRDMRLF